MANRLTQLEAVNIVLRGARETPVSSLDTDNINEVLQALQILDEWDLDIQTNGLYTNTFQQDLTPDPTTGFIDLSPNVLYVTGWGRNIRRELNYIEENGTLRLFDIENNTTIFNTGDAQVTSMFIRVYMRLDFENGLTYKQQRWIVDESAREYQMVTVGSRSMDEALRVRAARSRAMARRENMTQMRPNMFNNSRSNLSRAQARTVIRAWLPESDGDRTFRRT